MACGALDLGIRHAQLGLRGLQRLGHAVDQGAGPVGLALGDELPVDQHLLALVVAHGFSQVYLGAGNGGRAGRGMGPGGEHGSVRGVHIGLRLANAVLESLGIDAGR